MVATTGAVCTGLALAGFCGVRFTVPLFFVSLFSRDPSSEGYHTGPLYCLGTAWFTWLSCLLMIVECIVDLTGSFVDWREKRIFVTVSTMLAGALVCAPPTASPGGWIALLLVGGLLAVLSHLARLFFRESAVEQMAGCLFGCCSSFVEDLLMFTLVPAVIYSKFMAWLVVFMTLGFVMLALWSAANYPLRHKESVNVSPMLQHDGDDHIGYHVLSDSNLFRGLSSRWIGNTDSRWSAGTSTLESLLTPSGRRELAQNIAESIRVLQGVRRRGLVTPVSSASPTPSAAKKSEAPAQFVALAPANTGRDPTGSVSLAAARSAGAVAYSGAAAVPPIQAGVAAYPRAAAVPPTWTGVADYPRAATALPPRAGVAANPGVAAPVPAGVVAYPGAGAAPIIQTGTGTYLGPTMASPRTVAGPGYTATHPAMLGTVTGNISAATRQATVGAIPGAAYMATQSATPRTVASTAYVATPGAATAQGVVHAATDRAMPSFSMVEESAPRASTAVAAVRFAPPRAE